LEEYEIEEREEDCPAACKKDEMGAVSLRAAVFIIVLGEFGG
jgi:hypothetical protein